MGDFLYKVWNQIVKIKWERAFKGDIVKNDEGEVVKVFYDKDYYIQKGIGIKSINPIIGDKVKQSGINDNAFQEIQKIMFESKVKIDDWRNGGPFSGFNSESGFGKIRQMIQNNLPVPQE
ncbi:hypothetical protein [Paraflavitalea speifideaquila]|uniref:hypothetical protein n=1 Tax=Paraflavitalea speifideaquila TaxID=3076558 RepID=UPI0028E8107D|nr:hypothetical protein [Paraflavitalea speifideiaquila]